MFFYVVNEAAFGVEVVVSADGSGRGFAAGSAFATGGLRFGGDFFFVVGRSAPGK